MNIRNGAENLLKNFENISNNGSGSSGYASGIKELDDKLGRWVSNSRFIVIAGRPGSGKSALAMQVMESVALQGASVVFFSFEMPVNEIMRRYVSQKFPTSNKITLSNLEDFGVEELTETEEDEVIDVVDYLAELPIWLETELSSYLEIEPRLKQIDAEIAEKGLPPVGLVVIDYIQRAVNVGSIVESSMFRLQLGAAAQDFKRLSKLRDIPVIAISQSSRNTSKKSHSQNDIADSDMITQDMDLCLSVEKDKPLPSNSNNAQIQVTKNKRGDLPAINLNCTKKLRFGVDTIASPDYKGLMK